jgi:hypothetical protein
MREPYPLAARRKSEGEFLLCILANLFYMSGIDEINPQEIEDKLIDPALLYRVAGELTLSLFLLREGDFQVHTVGQNRTRERLENWLGEESVSWFSTRLRETPRTPRLEDIDLFIGDGWAVTATTFEPYGEEVIVPASDVLIAGLTQPMIYSPAAENGEPHIYNKNPFWRHWNADKGIVAVRPA